MQLLSDSASLLLRRGIRRGFLTLTREREYVTTIGALIGVVFLAQMLLFVVFGIAGTHRLIESRLDLRLQVQDTAEHQQVQEFLVAVRTLPIVRRVVYVTREQAYERERARNPDLIAFLEEFNVQNPFPDTIAVSLVSLKDYDSFAGFVRQAQWNAVVDPAFLSDVTSQEQEVRQMLRFTSAGRALALTVLSLLILVLIIVLVELTRRRSMQRQEEIFVERIVGAPLPSILLPFVTEATVLLLLSVLVSTALILLLLPLLPVFIPAINDGGAFFALRMETMAILWRALPYLIIIEIALIPVLSAAGAFLGMRPHMKKGGLSLAIT